MVPILSRWTENMKILHTKQKSRYGVNWQELLKGKRSSSCSQWFNMNQLLLQRKTSQFIRLITTGLCLSHASKIAGSIPGQSASRVTIFSGSVEQQVQQLVKLWGTIQSKYCEKPDAWLMQLDNHDLTLLPVVMKVPNCAVNFDLWGSQWVIAVWFSAPITTPNKTV